MDYQKQLYRDDCELYGHEWFEINGKDECVRCGMILEKDENEDESGDE